MWFQQDGARCHTARETIDLLRQHFPGRVISRNANVNWPLSSCDLTPCDFFLWGFVNSKVYANKPLIISEFKTEIQRVITEIEPTDLEIVFGNSHQKGHVILAQPRRTYGPHHIPQLISTCLLYKSIKIAQLNNSLLCFILKLNPAYLMGHPLFNCFQTFEWRCT